MKKIINWFRDLIYNFTDYVIILCVIVGVAAILIWRFNILFDIKIDKDAIVPVAPPPIEIIEDNKDNTNTDNDENSDNPADDTNTDDENSDNDTPDDSKDNPTDNTDNNTDNNTDDETNGTGSTEVAAGTEITFNIPSGSFPSKIADILIANNLIDDKQVFLTRCVELKLDTKLKSGDFTIKKGTPLDDIIKAIAK